MNKHINSSINKRKKIFIGSTLFQFGFCIGVNNCLQIYSSCISNDVFFPSFKCKKGDVHYSLNSIINFIFKIN